MRRGLKIDLKESGLFSLFYILIFNLFYFPTLTDSGQTTNVFFVITVIVSFLTTTAYVLIHLLLKRRTTFIYYLMNVLLLFVLSELSTLLIGGVIPFFGVFYHSGFAHNFSNYKDAPADMLAFRQSRDYAMSMSAIISSSLSMIIGYRTNKRFE